MHWVRNPRLNSAVATVAVLMVLSLLRVASLSLVMVLGSQFAVIPGRAKREPGISRFRVQGFALPRNDGASINRRLAHGPAKTRFEKIKIAALIGLLDVAGEHPAI